MPGFSELDEIRVVRGMPERPRVPECAIDYLAEERATKAAEAHPGAEAGVLTKAGLALRGLFAGLLRQRRAER